MATPIYQVPTSNNQQYTLDSNYTAGGSTLVLSQDVSSVVQSPGICVVDRVDSNGNKTPTKRTYYSFTGVSSATLTGVTSVDGTDQVHSVGAIVEFVPDVKWAQSIYDALSNVCDVDTQALDTTKVADLDSTQTLENKTLTSPITTGTDTGTATLTNKRITKRITTITSAAKPTINSDNCDVVDITAQGEAITSMTDNLSGTPTNFQTLIIRFKDDGTGRAITWGAKFEARGTSLPTTTIASKILTIGLIYDTTTSKWGCVASQQEA